MQFNIVASMIDTIGKTSSRNEKMALLKKYKDTVGFKEILKFIYDPYNKTGIKLTKLNKGTDTFTLHVSWQDFINHFMAHQTGSDADVKMARTFVQQQTNEYTKKLAIAMATKTLKIGITENTLNKVFGKGFIPKIGIMRGLHYKDVGGNGPFIVTEKLDGARRLLVRSGGATTLYTRSGHIDEGLVDIENEARYLPDNMVFDGELLAEGVFKNSIEQRQATNAIANSKGVRHGVILHVFDVIPMSDFRNGVSIHDALHRKLLCAALLADSKSLKILKPDSYREILDELAISNTFTFIRPVPVLGVARTTDEVIEFARPIWNRGFEGVMLNTLDGKYEIASAGRKQLLKVKNVVECTLECVGIYSGNAGTKYYGTTGGIYLRYKDGKVGCGSGLNDKQRDMFWKNPELIVGKMIEIDSFGESTNKSGGVSLNCPIFKRIVGEE